MSGRRPRETHTGGVSRASGGGAPSSPSAAPRTSIWSSSQQPERRRSNGANGAPPRGRGSSAREQGDDGGGVVGGGRDSASAHGHRPGGGGGGGWGGGVPGNDGWLHPDGGGGGSANGYSVKYFGVSNGQLGVLTKRTHLAGAREATAAEEAVPGFIGGAQSTLWSGGGSSGGVSGGRSSESGGAIGGSGGLALARPMSQREAFLAKSGGGGGGRGGGGVSRGDDGGSLKPRGTISRSGMIRYDHGDAGGGEDGTRFGLSTGFGYLSRSGTWHRGGGGGLDGLDDDLHNIAAPSGSVSHAWAMKRASGSGGGSTSRDVATGATDCAVRVDDAGGGRGGGGGGGGGGGRGARDTRPAADPTIRQTERGEDASAGGRWSGEDYYAGEEGERGGGGVDPSAIPEDATSLPPEEDVDDESGRYHAASHAAGAPRSKTGQTSRARASRASVVDERAAAAAAEYAPRPSTTPGSFYGGVRYGGSPSRSHHQQHSSSSQDAAALWDSVGRGGTATIKGWMHPGGVEDSGGAAESMPWAVTGAVSGRGLRGHSWRRGDLPRRGASRVPGSSSVGGGGGGGGLHARQSSALDAGRDAYERRAVPNYGNNGGMTTDRTSGKSWVSHNGLAGWKLSMTLSHKHAPALPSPVPARPKR